MTRERETDRPSQTPRSRVRQKERWTAEEKGERPRTNSVIYKIIKINISAVC